MKRLLVNLVAFGALWLLITEARADSWFVGVPVVVAASTVSARLASRRQWRWTAMGFLQFAPYFVRHSFFGGLDVAWRSLHPRLPIDPQMIRYNLRLPDGTARVFFLNVVNLLPGTVAADVGEEVGEVVVMVHVIDGRQPMHQELLRLEQAVAKLFALQLEPVEDSGRSAPCR